MTTFFSLYRRHCNSLQNIHNNNKKVRHQYTCRKLSWWITLYNFRIQTLQEVIEKTPKKRGRVASGGGGFHLSFIFQLFVVIEIYLQSKRKKRRRKWKSKKKRCLTPKQTRNRAANGNRRAWSECLNKTSQTGAAAPASCQKVITSRKKGFFIIVSNILLFFSDY